MADHRTGCRHGCNFWVWPDSEGLAQLAAHYKLHEENKITQSGSSRRENGCGYSYEVNDG
jgi:hypothetical protein